MKMFHLPADCNAVDIGANDGEITSSVQFSLTFLI